MALSRFQTDAVMYVTCRRVVTERKPRILRWGRKRNLLSQSPFQEASSPSLACCTPTSWTHPAAPAAFAFRHCSFPFVRMQATDERASSGTRPLRVPGSGSSWVVWIKRGSGASGCVGGCFLCSARTSRSSSLQRVYVVCGNSAGKLGLKTELEQLNSGAWLGGKISRTFSWTELPSFVAPWPSHRLVRSRVSKYNRENLGKQWNLGRQVFSGNPLGTRERDGGHSME